MEISHDLVPDRPVATGLQPTIRTETKMHIAKVISYKDSWNICKINYKNELSDIQATLSLLLAGKITLGKEQEYTSQREFWNKGLYDCGWDLVDRTHYTQDGKRVSIGVLGPVKNGLCASLSMGFPDMLGRWLFQQTAIACRHKFVSLPVLIAPIKDFARRLENSMLSRVNFETIYSQLEMLSPLSHPYPFLIVGYSDQEIAGDPEILTILDDIKASELNHAIDRCLTFPPEYHQAGLGILNYFGTYLRDNYPDTEATVKIEQHGLNVRLIIETPDGQVDSVEKALHEYELIVTRQEPPEKFTHNEKLILELKNELRVAQFRIESQQDIISIQNTRIDKLFNLLGDGLANRQPITIDFKPTISLSNNIQLNKDISYVLGNLDELQELLPAGSNAHFVIEELGRSLEPLEKETNPEVVKNSGAMSKFRKILENIASGEDSLKNVIDATEQGWDLMREIAGKYNKLAEWCGLPQVPSIFVK